MADLLDMEKLEHLINLEERLRLHPNLKAIYDTVMYELVEINADCQKKVDVRRKKEEEEAQAKAKKEGEERLKAEADAKAKSEAAQKKLEKSYG